MEKWVSELLESLERHLPDTFRDLKERFGEDTHALVAFLGRCKGAHDSHSVLYQLGGGKYESAREMIARGLYVLGRESAS